MRVPLIYRDRPLFGFDLGSRTAKMIQLKPHGKSMQVLGYGYADFPADALVEGIVVDPQEIAKALRPLLKQMSYGHINATRAAVSLPTAKVFTRMLELPPMGASDLAQAIKFEAEQYIPVPLADLYIDYETITASSERNDVLMVAAPRSIVDSYIKLFDILGLEVAFIESSMASVTRAIIAAQPTTQTTLIADFGSTSIDLTIHDDTIRLTDTIKVGGDDLTSSLMAKLEIERDSAVDIKYKFGIAKSDLQPRIKEAMEPHLAVIATEIKRVCKYYEERSVDKHKVETIVISGGSASMPGLGEDLSERLQVKVQIANPWTNLEVKGIQSVSKHDAPMYATAIGLARLEGKI